MLWKHGDICPVQLDNGIVIDYVHGCFILILKDDVWQEYEIHALQKHKVHLSFLYERICAIFMFAIEDAVETSDASFDIHLCDEAENILSLADGECYSIEVYLIDSSHQICARRKLTLSLPASLLLKEALLKQQNTPYDEAGYDRALQKIQIQQPFELEERADFHEIF